MIDFDHEAWQENWLIRMAALQAQINDLKELVDINTQERALLRQRVEQLEFNQCRRLNGELEKCPHSHQ